MKRFTPASRAAMRTFSVPCTFTSFVETGSSTLRATDGSAAWCSTYFCPFIARATSPGLRMSPSTTRSCRPSRWAMFCMRPVVKLSRTVTVWPSWTSRSARWEPMKPAPPVTR